VMCHHSAPRNMKWLPNVDRVVQTPTQDADLGIIVDLDSIERLGNVGEFFIDLPRLVVIDHHVPHEAPGDIRIVETTAAATALILTRLVEQLGGTITKEMATCFYTGIVTDTGSFRFRNTSSDALAAAATLLECGADLETVSQQVFQSKQLSSARLLGHALETMKLDMDEKLAWTCLSNRDFEWAKATDEDTEGFVNELLSIETVQIAAMLREPKSGKIRCSIRSRGTYDVAAVAREFGGGGHKNAAGCTFETTLSEAEDALVQVMRRCLESS
jgi:bifunctional oligoribonuclease and PAP phosphatase NrnA